MTDKEKEAIKNVTKILNKKIDLKIYSHTDYKIINKAYKVYTDNDIRTVLNLIQTQQEEIEKLKNMELKAKDGRVSVTLEGLIKLEDEIKNRDKIIDKMTGWIESLYSSLVQEFGSWMVPFSKDNQNTNKKEIKQYFEKKVEDK